MKKIVCLVIYTYLTASLAAAEKPRDGEGEARGARPAVWVGLYGYDTSGQTGIGIIRNNNIGEICWQLDNYELSNCFPGISIASNVDFQYANEPFSFTNDIPFYGKLRGKGMVTYTQVARYVIPIDEETADIAEIETDSYGFGANVLFQPYILDRIDGPSIGYPTEILIGELPSPLNKRGATVIAEYLEGNVLEGEFPVTHRYQPGSLLRNKPNIRWGKAVDPTTHGPNLVTLGNTIPVGPVKLTFAFDGYTTDTVTLSIIEDKVHYWKNAAVPIDGLSPNASSYFGNSYRIGFDNDLPDGMMINDAGHRRGSKDRTGEGRLPMRAKNFHPLPPIKTIPPNIFEGTITFAGESKPFEVELP